VLIALPILAEADTGDLIKPIAGLVVILLVLAVSVRILRRMMSSHNAPDDIPAAGFSLASLRELVKQGKMTPEEFEKAKAQIVAATQRATEKKKPVTDVPPEMKTGREFDK